MVLLLSASPLFAQTGPPPVTYGCPTAILGFWATMEDPDFEPPNVDLSGYSSKICYECFVCDAVLNPDCPPCMQIIKFDAVFNPETNTYETIYKVISHNSGSTIYNYAYMAFKVPIWELDENGKRVKIVGYKFYWKPIPRLNSVQVDLGGRLTMVFN